MWYRPTGGGNWLASNVRSVIVADVGVAANSAGVEAASPESVSITAKGLPGPELKFPTHSLTRASGWSLDHDSEEE